MPFSRFILLIDASLLQESFCAVAADVIQRDDAEDETYYISCEYGYDLKHCSGLNCTVCSRSVERVEFIVSDEVEYAAYDVKYRKYSDYTAESARKRTSNDC